jgi:Fe-S oxidoreductase
LINLKTADGVRQIRQIAEKSVELVAQYNGTISGEHGQGVARGEFSEKLFGSKLVQAFKEVKSSFDPQNLMNPGKLVDVAPMDDERLLRFGSQYAVPYEPKDTAYAFRIDGGFARAVEMCNGAGVCRKLEEGVMCPSFKILQDETHSTRGRANALRAAMMGLLGPDAMTSEELYQVLDLCLSCQGCKSECPSAVDLSKIKAEFLYGYYKKNGIPLRSRIFANIGRLNALGQIVHPLTNAILAGPGKWIMTQIGVHPNRSLPQLAPQTFTEWFQSHNSDHPDIASTRSKVVFFHDTFMEHNDPHIGQAAVKILEATGYDLIVLKEKVDSGRPAVSKGLLDEAKRLARHNIELLAPYAKQGIPIVGCEPSSMAMLVDDYPDLLPGEDAEAVAKMARMLDQFLVEEVEAGKIKLRFDETPRRVLFHGHCQQKAVFGTDSVHKMLGLIPNCEVEEIESSCCGMAGSFGYEVEHYDLSIQLAELSLAPAIRAADQETIICAMGTSCRDQIEHTTGRQALHPIEVLADALLVPVKTDLPT